MFSPPPPPPSITPRASSSPSCFSLLFSHAALDGLSSGPRVKDGEEEEEGEEVVQELQCLDDDDDEKEDDSHDEGDSSSLSAIVTVDHLSDKDRKAWPITKFINK